MSAVDPVSAFMVDRSADAKSVGGLRFVCTTAREVTAENVRGRKFVFTAETRVFAQTV